MNGTNRLDLIVGHGAEFLLTTGNGFAKTTTHGARNVLIEEMSNFTFIEKSHKRVPMWNVFGDFVVKEGASVSILNTYMTTPSDNYNIYFKETNQKFILDNPKYVNIYTKNANVKIEYDNKTLTSSADEDGLFEASIDSTILDNKRVKIISCLNGSFTERKVITPFIGELTLLKVTDNIPFSMSTSSTSTSS